jgi:thiol:disulfide interchange protein DsbA
MSVSRRSLLQFAAGGLAVLGTGLSIAQEAQRSFEQSFRAITPQPSTVGADKIEIIDFFWYGCPYCYELLPLINAWEKTKPADVVMRRIPAILRQEWVPDAHLYYTLEVLGAADRLHTSVFDAVHKNRLQATNIEVWAKWASSNGIDRAKWDEAYNGREVRDRVVRAVELGRDYDVRGTPVIIVDGRYQTGSGPAGSLKNVMPTVDGLINLVRANRKKT